MADLNLAVFWLPAIFLFFVPLAKVIKRRQQIDLIWSDWHVGFDFIVSVFASAVVQGFTKLHTLGLGGPIFEPKNLSNISGSIAMMAASFFVWGGLLLLHAASENPRIFFHSQREVLLFFFDLGVGLFMWYLLGKLGGFL
jgi:hypothetical protein